MKKNLPVSIISSCKNEFTNLPKFLDFLRNQEYPNHTITVVDDYSSDGSSEYLMSQKGLKVIQPSYDFPGKKLGLQEAIMDTQHDYILVTDVDCTGTGQWVNTMMAALDDKEIILGYAPLRAAKSLASLFACYETWLTAIQYLSYAISKIPFMGVGRNLLFAKKLFSQVHGFQSHIDLISGDDDLFVNSVANGYNTGICLNQNTFMYSDAPATWNAFLSQKRRHLTTATRYKIKHQVLLAGFSFSHILCYLLVIISIFTSSWKLAGTFLLLKWIIQSLIALPVMHRMNEGRLWRWIPILDFIMFLYYVVMAPFTFIKKKKTWK